MSNGNRLYWFEWAFGLGGAAIFVSLGLLAIAQRHIVLGSRFSFKLLRFDGASAILLGAVLLAAACVCFNLVLRTTSLRRIWQVVVFVIAAALGAVAYGNGFDF